MARAGLTDVSDIMRIKKVDVEMRRTSPSCYTYYARITVDLNIMGRELRLEGESELWCGEIGCLGFSDGGSGYRDERICVDEAWQVVKKKLYDELQRMGLKPSSTLVREIVGAVREAVSNTMPYYTDPFHDDP